MSELGTVVRSGTVNQPDEPVRQLLPAPREATIEPIISRPSMNERRPIDKTINELFSADG